MRIFQIKIEKIDQYEWTLDNGDYQERYKAQRAEGQALAEAQALKLTSLGIVVHERAGTIVTSDQMTSLIVADIKFELVQEIPVGEQDDLNGTMRKFNRMAAKLMSLPGLQRNDVNHDCQNEKVHVHMPGQALSVYNEVQLLENSCTDELQRSLDDGWRIIAACPQPDARRPDYILGRFNAAYNPTENHHNYAKRGT